MSLKAKLEAVIYAAEEPVTLTQLAALFAADALEWKAAQEAAAAEQTAEFAGERPGSEPLPLLAEGLEYLSLADTPDVYAGRMPEAEQEPPAERETVKADESEAAPASATSAADEARPAGFAESSQDPAIAVGQPYKSVSVEEPDDGMAENSSGADSVPSDGSSTSTASAPIDIEVEAKRLARLRDREVKGVLKQLLDELIASSAADNRGVEIREIAGGYRMATKPECHDAVRMFVKSLKPAMKLSLPALETLAVVAYKQPVTAPEVNEIRGVESAGVLGSLLARKLIATAGRKPVIGRPILYKTTKEFLLRFGLKDVSELPSMEEFEKMAAMELEESGPSGDGSEATNVEEAGAEEAGAVDSDEQMLEFNSPSGEELGESLEGPQSGAEAQTHEAAAAPSKSESDGGAIAVSAAGADQAPHSVSPNQTQKAAPAKPEDSEQAETGAVPDAQEDKRDG